jgi:hypothetical protein
MQFHYDLIVHLSPYLCDDKEFPYEWPNGALHAVLERDRQRETESLILWLPLH